MPAGAFARTATAYEMSKHDWHKSHGAPPEDEAAREREGIPGNGRDGSTSEAASDAGQNPAQDGPSARAERPRSLDKALDQIDLLREQLAAKTEEAAQTHDRLLRERAELENFKRRMQREKSEALRFACEPLLRDLLPVIDNLERAVEAASKAEAALDPAAQGNRVDGLISGVKMVLQQFGEVLGRFGVTRIAASGQSFDPSQHEAVAQVDSEAPPGSVVDEYAPGYRLHDRLLRPAQVTVAKPPRVN
jgi:molecular chaperone GrpE